MRLQFKIQFAVVILLITAFILVSLVSRAQSAPNSGAVRAHVIDSLKQIYEANMLTIKRDTIPVLRAEKPKCLPIIKEKSKEIGEIKVKDIIFTVYQGTKGGLYYFKVSGKTGLTYRKYLSPAEKAQLTGGN